MSVRLARALPCLAAFLAVTGCNLMEEFDWRKGEESVDACVERLSKGRAPMENIARGNDLWVPRYTYDVTRMGAEAMMDLVKPQPGAESGEASATGTVAMGDESYIAAQREKFRREPATRAGAIFLAEDPALYKVLGEPGPERTLLRQGCAMQKPGMRLISWQYTKADYFEEGQPDGHDVPPEVIEKIKAL